MRRIIFLLIFGLVAFLIGIAWRPSAPANRPPIAPIVDPPSIAPAPQPQPISPKTEAEKIVGENQAPKSQKREIRTGDLVIFEEGPIPGARLAARNRKGLAILRKSEKGGFTRSERQELLRRQLVWIVGDGIEARVVEVGAEYLRVRVREGNDFAYIRKEYVHVKE